MSNVVRGHIASCGCYQAESVADRSRTHGLTKIPEYKVWGSIIQRCTNPTAQAFQDYGGRGIRICDEWLNSFEAFIAHVGRRPGPEYEIDRINNDGHYEPGNVRWVTSKANMRNRRTTRRYAVEGCSMPLGELAEESGVPYSILVGRLRRGWSIEKAIMTPVRRTA
jgi:hypothetical protein